jgi:ABC-2 type transport system permease protein
MIASSKAGLAYYEKNYSPYQFKQFRILEFPRYRGFAQSFPNTVPYTEPGFISRVVDPQKDIDRTYFVTAHELAHQWWGHQLIGGAVAGSNMMSESLLSTPPSASPRRNTATTRCKSSSSTN